MLTIENGGLLLPLKTVDWILVALRDGVECPFDDGFRPSEGVWMWKLLQSASCLCPEACCLPDSQCIITPQWSEIDPLYGNLHGVTKSTEKPFCTLSRPPLERLATEFTVRRFSRSERRTRVSLATQLLNVVSFGRLFLRFLFLFCLRLIDCQLWIFCLCELFDLGWFIYR